jgi:hypothetical protein
MMRRSGTRMTVARLHRKVDRIERRLRTKADKADVRRLERRMNQRFAAVDRRFAAIDARFDTLEARMAIMDKRLHDKLDLFLDNHERRIQDLEAAAAERRATH